MIKFIHKFKEDEAVVEVLFFPSKIVDEVMRLIEIITYNDS